MEQGKQQPEISSRQVGMGARDQEQRMGRKGRAQKAGQSMDVVFRCRARGKLLDIENQNGYVCWEHGMGMGVYGQYSMVQGMRTRIIKRDMLEIGEAIQCRE